MPHEAAERRYLKRPIEVREKTLFGVSCPFNSESGDLGGFREVFLPGAFSKALASGEHVVALENHDPNRMVATTRNGSLKLTETDAGLEAEIHPMNTQASADVRAIVEGGAANGMSFAFMVTAEGQKWRSTPEGVVREIHEVSELLDVSVITGTKPAYSATQVSARALAEARSLTAQKEEPLKPNAEEVRKKVMARLGDPRPADKRERSIEDWSAAVFSALCALLGDPWGMCEDGAYGYRWCVEATFADRVVIETFEGVRKLYQYPMTFDAAGVPSFGAPIEVEEQYVAVAPLADGTRNEAAPGVPNEINEARLKLAAE